MPINFENKIIYTINYAQLFEYLDSFDIFKCEKIQKAYLTDWISILKKYDKKSIDNIEMSTNNIPSNFYFYEFYFGSILLRINFNISKIIKSFISYPSISFETKYFSKDFENQCSFFWSNPTTKILNITNNTPIIAIPFYLTPTSKYLIIDGNHRIAHALKYNIQNIEISILSNKLLINKDYFLTEFDFYLYAFNNEIVQLLHYRNKHKFLYSDKMMLKKSYLYSKKFKFKYDF